MDNKSFYTMRELAKELGVSPETLKGWRKNKKPVVRYVTFIERKPIMTAENLHRYLHSLPAVGEVPPND